MNKFEAARHINEFYRNNKIGAIVWVRDSRSNDAEFISSSGVELYRLDYLTTSREPKIELASAKRFVEACLDGRYVEPGHYTGTEQLTDMERLIGRLGRCLHAYVDRDDGSNDQLFDESRRVLSLIPHRLLGTNVVDCNVAEGEEI